MTQELVIGEQFRVKIVETFVRIEHLPIMNTTEGLAIFGQICRMAGRCCEYIAEGRLDQALKVAKTVGRSVPHAFSVGTQRGALEDALEELIAVLERPQISQYH